MEILQKKNRCEISKTLRKVPDPLSVLPKLGKTPSGTLVMLTVTGSIILLLIPLLSCICCFACPVRTKYSRMLEERRFRKKSIAERRKERNEAEEKRLKELEEQRQLAAEFYQRISKTPFFTLSELL